VGQPEHSGRGGRPRQPTSVSSLATWFSDPAWRTSLFPLLTSSWTWESSLQAPRAPSSVGALLLLLVNSIGHDTSPPPRLGYWPNSLVHCSKWRAISPGPLWRRRFSVNQRRAGAILGHSVHNLTRVRTLWPVFSAAEGWSVRSGRLQRRLISSRRVPRRQPGNPERARRLTGSRGLRRPCSDIRASRSLRRCPR
jgi:hypothetical protein